VLVLRCSILRKSLRKSFISGFRLSNFFANREVTD
jgi:hypothetical protein